MVHVLPLDPGALARSIGQLGKVGVTSIIKRRPRLPTEPSWYSSATHVAEEFGESSQLRAMFFGVSTIALTDGQTTLMFDGFFSRPPASTVLFGKVQPQHAVIATALNRANITSLDAVLVAHSHYDHALDAPAVAWRTGAQLVGSESTLNIGRGFGLTDAALRRVDVGEPMQFGRFSVTTILSQHSPKPKFTGFIEGPLHAPARARDYRVGECYSFLVTHSGEGQRQKRVLLHASAGFAPECLAGYRADIAFLGVAPIGKQSDGYRQQYWEQTVGMVGARRVYPTHWDDFTLPLSQPLVPLPYIADDFDTTLDFLARRREADGVEVLLPEPFVVMDPFAELT